MHVAEVRGIIIYEASLAGLKILKLPASNKNSYNWLWKGKQRTSDENGENPC